MSRHGRLYVRAALGEVPLEVSITSAGPARDIVKAAAVPGVRSVVDAMEVTPAAPASKSGPVTAAASATESQPSARPRGGRREGTGSATRLRLLLKVALLQAPRQRRGRASIISPAVNRVHVLSCI